ncbi:polysaccharide deacetylase family protein [Streptomyces sp. NPDC051104]|uniref:polysaccharide deacetylase family protein n=1 Tax=Streptomyces sp. NPDC051104 TaxID=3155044 RepID=UPI003426E33E
MTRPHGPFAGGRAAALLAPVAAVAAVHISPAATWLPGLRRRFLPGLAGVGRPDHIALTFDDGPDPGSTPHFLDALDQLDVRATFFVLGESVVRYPALTREIAERGHELAVHGWSHDRPWLPSPARDTADLVRTVDTVHDAAGRRPRWYRPPYGILTSGRWAAARRAGLRPVLWTAWGKDWTADATPASVRATAGAELRGGGTLLLHDSDHAAAVGCWRATLGALPGIVDDCREAGLSVGPLGEHGVEAGAEETAAREAAAGCVGGA